MKIQSLQTVRVASHPNLIWVQVQSHEGVTGLGETYFGAGAVEADIHDRIAPLLLGEDARRIEHLNAKMQPYTGFTGSGAEMRALSAVDVALWDMAAKSAGMALCDFLGGRARDTIQVYNTCAGPDYVSKTSAVRPDNFGTDSSRESTSGRVIYEDLDGFKHHPEELAASLLEMGIHSMKIWPFDFAEGAHDGIDISVPDLKKALEPFEKIRAAHGDKMRLKAELHGLWSLNAAKKIADALQPLGIDWIEDPVWMDRMDALAELSAYTQAPLAGGETLAGLGHFDALINQGNIDTPIMDITWGGGVTAARKVATMAAARSRPLSFHDCSGPITLAVSTHLALHLANVREQEIARGFYYGWYQDFVDQLPAVKNGFITVPEKAGLGVELLPDIVKRSDALVRTSTVS